MASELYLNPLKNDVPLYFQNKKIDTSNLQNSRTVYVGNLSFNTTENQIFSLFSQVGPIEQLILGINKQTEKFCGFCFVIYYERQGALKACNCLHGSTLDGRLIKVEIDVGFEEGRQYGRGLSGNQVRDEKRRERAKFSSMNNSVIQCWIIQINTFIIMNISIIFRKNYGVATSTYALFFSYKSIYIIRPGFSWLMPCKNRT